MAKQPPNTPTRMGKVILRGRGSRKGVLVALDDATNWARVEWGDGSGPRICHLFELERADKNEGC